MKRRALLGGLAGLGAAAMAGVALWRGRSGDGFGAGLWSGMGAGMTVNIDIDGHLMGRPVAWRDATSGAWAVAAVVAQGVGRNTRMMLHAYTLKGQPLAGFPRLTEGETEVPPGYQLFGGGEQPPLVMDRGGRVHRLDGTALGVPAQPALGLLAAPATPLPAAAGASARTLLLAGDMQPMMAGSRNALAIVDAQGRLLGGQPLELDDEPAPQQAVVDPQGRLAWVLLRSGAVDAVNLADGRRPAGWPVLGPVMASVPKPGTPQRRCMALSADGQSLVVALGTAQLWRIDLRSLKGQLVTVSKAQQVTQVALAGGKLQALDEGTGQLLSLGAELQPEQVLELGKSAQAVLGSVALQPLPGAQPGLLLLAQPQANEREMIRKVFEEKAPASAHEDIKRLVDGRRRDLYADRPLTAAEQADLDDDYPELQRGWLEEHMGIDATSRAISTAPRAVYLVLRLGAKGWTVAHHDAIDGGMFKTNLRLAPLALPGFATPPGAPALALAVNADGQRAGLLRFQTLN